MKKMKMIFAIAVVLLVACVTPVMAQDFGVGVQFGVFVTGIVADIPVGPISLTPGVGYPFGIKAFANMSESSEDTEVFNAAPVFSLDATIPFDFGDNFRLKIGAGAWALTHIKDGTFMGTAGLKVRPEFFTNTGNWSVFINVDVPVIVFFPRDNADGTQGMKVEYNPLLTVFSVFTSSLGVMYRF
ncbi:hypothetical protein [Parasphaerochaeta coccoides]|uniref:Outer membrane protein beta-barrel domain-containing protein n=1 Tax=Parasphaerochaeta coccoides (strain ATCC BAA-1237 / DSM 17374 / SPN1) TaxID=760011 RepID=F4GM37_PARC1|nr:hypothetical protein [Parasphaerochaeta coccoides]AEC02512.1 hypothetical protein Spico_1304 [Parasphaerochaeta coccoides DSM 17374]